jgi:hypothetical protein
MESMEQCQTVTGCQEVDGTLVGSLGMEESGAKPRSCWTKGSQKVIAAERCMDGKERGGAKGKLRCEKSLVSTVKKETTSVATAAVAVSAVNRWKKAKNVISATRMFAAIPGTHLADTRAPPLPLHQEDVLIDLFDAFDHAKAQHITSSDFGIILQTFLNRQLTPQELHDLIDSADGMITDIGTISFTNFKNRMARAVHLFHAHGTFGDLACWFAGSL